MSIWGRIGNWLLKYIAPCFVYVPDFLRLYPEKHNDQTRCEAAFCDEVCEITFVE